MQQIDGAKVLQSYENQTVELTTTITNTISGDKTSTKLARIPGSSMIEHQVTPDSNTERVMITVSFRYGYQIFGWGKWSNTIRLSLDYVLEKLPKYLENK